MEGIDYAKNERRYKEKNISKKGKEKEDQSDKQQSPKDIFDELKNGSRLLAKDKKSQNYKLKRGIPDGIIFRSITYIYKRAERLSPVEDEYDWSRPDLLEKNSQKEKKKEDSVEKALRVKQRDEDSNNAGNGMDIHEDVKDEENFELVNREKSKNAMINALLDHYKELWNKEKPKEHNGGEIQNDKEDTFEEELLPQKQQQQQQKDDNNGEDDDELKDKESLPSNGDSSLKSAQLLAIDKKDKKLRMTQGIPSSLLFRSVDNLYKFTTRLSPVEDEYNWDHPERNPSTRDDSNNSETNKKNVGEQSGKASRAENANNKKSKSSGRKRKLRENQEGKGGKDVTTSSSSKIAKM